MHIFCLDYTVSVSKSYPLHVQNKLTTSPKQGRRSICAPSFKKAPAELDELKAMTKEELIQELIKAKITEARLKKGYEVKGDGTVILYGNKIIK